MRIVSALALVLLATGAPTFVPAVAQAGDEVRSMCVTDRGSLNIREFAGTGSRKIGSIPSGACVAVIGVCERGDRFCNVEYRGVNGFAARRFLR